MTIKAFQEFKNRIKTELGFGSIEGITLEIVKNVFSKFGYYRDPSHKGMKLDFRTRATWEVIQQYATKIKLQVKTIFNLIPQSTGFIERTKQQYKHTTTPAAKAAQARLDAAAKLSGVAGISAY